MGNEMRTYVCLFRCDTITHTGTVWIGVFDVLSLDPFESTSDRSCSESFYAAFISLAAECP